MDASKDDRKANRERILADPTLNDLKGTQKLYWVYLDEEHPLHVRRTLDQYYYHTLPDTEERDNDQTGIRYHNQHLKSTNLTQSTNPAPVLTMVDQLWIEGSRRAVPHHHQENPEVEDLLDISNDIKDLREIKDIRDELNIMSSIFHAQNEVMKAMEHMLRGRKNMDSNFTHMAGGLNGNADYSLEDINHQRMYHSPMLTVVDRNVREVDRLDIEQLLDLKNKEANLKLTQGIYKINDGTDKQGQTVMYFTVATIIFLPLSFMSSFLTIEVDEFPRSEDGKLSIHFVLQVICEFPPRYMVTNPSAVA
ncbi:hypothetical protein B0I37DRAFT_417528 [Chaetomium sp. MPI-CAGE-AT-0009]|nr:hypothetical protein B0I37DRAFT_417528 [Chaetomium sp. MPI-CAGE-AT-0009]